MKLERHYLSAIFPDMQPAEYTALCNSIREHGQVHPIIVFQGQVLDGWQRYRALSELGIDPRIEPFFGDETDAFAYVVAVNVCRSNPTPDQLAMVAADVEAMRSGTGPGSAV